MRTPVDAKGQTPFRRGHDSAFHSCHDGTMSDDARVTGGQDAHRGPVGPLPCRRSLSAFGKDTSFAGPVS